MWRLHHKENIYHQQFSVCECGGTEDENQTMELARKIGAEWVVLDAYRFRRRYQVEIHENGLKVISLGRLRTLRKKWKCRSHSESEYRLRGSEIRQ